MPEMTIGLKDAERYVGTPYLVGEFDCADLAARVQWELFGRVIALPTHRRRPAGARGQAQAIAGLRDAIADPIDAPATGCGVLMYEPDGDAPGDEARLWHIGTVFMRGAEVWVLHNSHKLGSAHLQPLADLQRYGLRLDGYYAWRVAP